MGKAVKTSDHYCKDRKYEPKDVTIIVVKEKRDIENEISGSFTVPLSRKDLSVLLD